MEAFLEVLGLLVLRLGVPLVITLLISSWLMKLDQKWHDAEIARQTRVLPTHDAPHCWEVMGCDPTKRDSCPAYRMRPLPCWLARQRLSGRVQEQCLNCLVFQTA